MRIENEEQKTQAVGKIRELKEKLSGNDSALIQMDSDLKNLEAEKQNKVNSYNDKISSLKDKIKNHKSGLTAQRKPAEIELKELEQAVLQFVIGV